MKSIILSFLFFSFLFAEAQNLVPNPSFEDTILFSNGQPGVKGWQHNISSPDYFTEYYSMNSSHIGVPENSRGSQLAFEGLAYFGIGVLDKRMLNVREYIQVKLLDSMVKGEKYEIEFYLSLADSFHLALNYNNIGIVLKKELEPNNLDHQVREFRPFYISDTAWNASNKTSWEKFHYTHVAEGGEDVLIIGCFLNDRDISIDTVGNGGNFPFALQGSYYYIDNLRVEWKDTSTSITEPTLSQQLSAYPNPASELFFLENNSQKVLQFQWYTIQGKSVHIPVSRNVNRFVFSLGDIPKGLYLLRVTAGEENTTIKVLKE